MLSVENAELQLSELETLESIYPNENEVVVQDVHHLAMMKAYVESDGSSIAPTKKLNITINMKLDDTNNILKVECTSPPTYPGETLPEIFLRCDAMTRNMQQKFNGDLEIFMQSTEIGECCLYQIVQWAIDNAAEYLTAPDVTLNNFEEKSDRPEPCKFTRMWIYSHHIYSKAKRKCILEWAKELDLTGFSMPGKPGVICIEGIQEHCEEYWQRVKRLNWQHIAVRHTEELVPVGHKFKNMCEIAFETHGPRSNHMDMGAFYSYLCQHDSEPMFAMLFGIAGKAKNSS